MPSELHAFGPDQHVDGALAGTLPRVPSTRTGPRVSSVTHPGRDASMVPAKMLLSPMNTHEAGARPVIDLEWWRYLLQPAVAEDGDAVGHRHGLRLVVGDVKPW